MSASRQLLCVVTICSCGLGAPCAAQDVQQLWIDRYNAPGNMNDYGEDIGVDADGNVYVTGFMFDEVQPGYFIPRFLTIKYTTSGERMWERTHGSATVPESANELEIDASNSVIVAGAFNFGEDWGIIKYTSQGDVAWENTYQANSTWLTQPDALISDADGNVYVTGAAGNPTIDYGPVVKYNSAGALQWSNNYTGAESSGAFGRALAVASDGSLYMAGGEVVSGAGSEAVVVKFSAAGGVVWSRTFGASGTVTHDRFLDIAIDGEGNVIATGLFGANTALGQDVATVKLDPDGNLLWSHTYVGPFRDDVGNSVAIDQDNNVIVAGSTDVEFDDSNVLLLKYDPDGQLLWQREYGSTGLDNDWARSVELDGTGAIYVCGVIRPFAFADYYWTAKYAPDGDLLWEQAYGGPMDGSSVLTAIALGPAGRVYVTGWSAGIGTQNDIATIAYAQSQSIPGDFDDDGDVDAADLATLLGDWGPCPGCPTDLNGDGTVDAADLAMLLGNWS